MWQKGHGYAATAGRTCRTICAQTPFIAANVAGRRQRGSEGDPKGFLRASCGLGTPLPFLALEIWKIGFRPRGQTMPSPKARYSFPFHRLRQSRALLVPGTFLTRLANRFSRRGSTQHLGRRSAGWRCIAVVTLRGVPTLSPRPLVGMGAPEPAICLDSPIFPLGRGQHHGRFGTGSVETVANLFPFRMGLQAKARLNLSGEDEC